MKEGGGERDRGLTPPAGGESAVDWETLGGEGEGVNRSLIH